MGEHTPSFSQHEKGYFCELYGTETGANEFRLAKHIDVGYQLIEAVEYDWIPGNYYYMRLRVVGDQLKAKVWAEGETEPYAWTIETTDADWTEGIAGVGNFNSEGDRLYDFVGIGWLGNPAPKEDFKR